MANIKICDELQIGKESANIDARYGPWLSKGEAVTTLSKWGTIAEGLTVGIIENNKIVEYWFQEGTDLDHLVLKNNGGGGSGSIEGAELQANKVTSIRTGVNEPEDSPTAPSDDKYPSEKAVALLYDNLETDVAETNRKIGDLSHFQDNLDYNPDPDNLNVGDILKGLETKIVEFNWALEGTDADKDSNVFNNTPYSGYSVWKVLGELYNAVQKKKYNVSFIVENGSKDPDNNYTNVPEGDTIEWVVTPYVNYKMPSHIDGAVIEDLNNGTYKVTVSDIQGDTEITCKCVPIELPITTHSVTISVNNGTVDGKSQKTFNVEHDSGISCVLEAIEHYHIPTSLPYSHMSISDSGILSITNVKADIEIAIDCIKNKYKVTLNINNGTTTSDNPQQVDAFGSAVFNLAADQYYELPSKTAENIPIVNGVITVENITSDRTITVNCRQIDYWILWDSDNADSGNDGIPSADHIHGGDILNNWPIYNGTKEGYTLLDDNNKSYWILTDSKGSYEVEMGSDTPYTVIGDLNVKPKWFVILTITVHFNMGDLSVNAPADVTVTKGGQVTMPYNTMYILKETHDDRFRLLGWEDTESDFEYTPGNVYNIYENTTLNAHYQVYPVYTVSFDLNGGTGTVPESQKIDGYEDYVIIPSLNGITKSGATPLGWGLDNSSTSTYSTPGERKTLTADNHTLYVIWEESTPHITIEPVGNEQYGIQEFQFNSDKSGFISVSTDAGTLNGRTISPGSGTLTLEGNDALTPTIILTDLGNEDINTKIVSVRTTIAGIVRVQTSSGVISRSATLGTTNLIDIVTSGSTAISGSTLVYITNTGTVDITPTITASQTVSNVTNYTLTATQTYNGVTGEATYTGTLTKTALGSKQLELGTIPFVYTAKFMFSAGVPEYTPSEEPLPEPIKALPNQTIIMPDNMQDYDSTTSGYGVTVEGWLDSSLGGGAPRIAGGSEYTMTKNVIFQVYGSHTIKPIISFDANGGTGTMDSLTVYWNRPYTAPTECGFTKDGYHFDEQWACVTSSDIYSYNSRYDAGETIYPKSGTTTYPGLRSAITLKPIWQQDGYYRVTFDSDGGTPALTSENRPSIAQGTSINLPSYTGTKGGYRLTGKWIITDINGTVKKNFEDTHTIVSNTRIKPEWELKNGTYKYLLVNEVPSTAPSMSQFSSSTETNTLGNLTGWNNWKNKDNQYIVFPKQSGKTNIEDYFDITDSITGGSGIDQFIIVSNANGMFVVLWDGFNPLSSADNDATITFK